MRLFLVCIISICFSFSCLGDRYWNSDGRNSRDNDFFNPHRKLKEDEKASRYKLDLLKNNQEMERLRIKHQLDLDKLRYQYRVQQLQQEKDLLQRELEILKLRQTLQNFKQKGY